MTDSTGALGARLKALREDAGLSLADLAQRSHFTRAHLSNVEHGRRAATPEVLMAYERLGLDRRAFLSAAAALTAEMLSSIAGGDEAWLSSNIAPYDFSVSLASLAARDQGTKRRLLRWLHGGSTSLLRGNAQGTLFKTQRPELIALAEQSMRYDEQTRNRCMRCFTRLTFGLSWPDASAYSAYNAPAGHVSKLAALLRDPADASNRWCAAVFLGEAVDSGSKVARQALLGALRSEESIENVRAIGLALNGEKPWK